MRNSTHFFGTVVHRLGSFAICLTRSLCKAQIQGARKSKACSIAQAQSKQVQGGQLAWHDQGGPRREGTGEARKRSSLRSSLSSGGGPSTSAVPCNGMGSSVVRRLWPQQRQGRLPGQALRHRRRNNGGAERAREPDKLSSLRPS